MKSFLHKVQDLGKKAAELKQAVQAAPAKAAQIREAITMTAGELHQLRVDVQTNLTELRANSEDHLLKAMRELSNSARTFEEAGYTLTGIDLDLALNQRLAVHLEKVSDVPHATLRALLDREKLATVKPVLNGIIKAEETAANVELQSLEYLGLVIHIGLTPLIRICWRNPDMVATPPPLPGVAPLATPAGPATIASTYTPSTFFEQRTVAAAAATPPPLPEPAVPAPTSTSPLTLSKPVAVTSEPAAPRSAQWSADALSRFKTMPGVSKYRR